MSFVFSNSASTSECSKIPSAHRKRLGERVPAYSAEYWRNQKRDLDHWFRFWGAIPLLVGAFIYDWNPLVPVGFLVISWMISIHCYQRSRDAGICIFNADYSDNDYYNPEVESSS